jgi:EAL domain-containing protein (putative c-di-GMP-specific phosphodiesterase class I)
VLLIEELKTADEAMISANRVLERFNEPFQIAGVEVVISPSIGIAIFPDDASDANVLLKCADLAMYEAKSAGRNTIRSYSTQQSQAAIERAEIENLLRLALDRDQFELYFQPAYDLVTNKPVMVEALLRWRHPQRGLVTPDAFIPILEDCGLIVPVGLWVLHESLAQLKAWDDVGMHGLNMAVNVSVLQLSRSDLTAALSELLDQYRLPGERLTLELTESLVMANPERSIETLKKISALGIQIAVDDFGTGYSSLAYLKRLPIDKLKIDKAFVHDLGTDADDTAIVGSIIALAKALDIQVTAEGVESAEQLRLLIELGCREAQGFYYAKPMDRDSCTAFLRERLHAQI